MAKHKISLDTPSAKALPKKNKGQETYFIWKSMTNWLILLVTILPVLFSWQSTDPVVTIRYIFLGWFILLFVLYFFVLQKQPQHRFLRPVKFVFAFGVCYALWSAVSMLFSINIAIGYYEVARHLLNIILLFLVMLTVVQEEPQVLKLCKALVIASVIQSAAGILQYHNADIIAIPGAENARPYGFMGNRNLFGSAQAFILPFVLFVLYSAGRLWKYTSFVAVIGVAVSVLISQSRSAWLAAIALLLFSFILMILFLQKHRKVWITASLFGLIIILTVVSLLSISDKGGPLFKVVKAKAFTLIQPGSDSSSGQLRFIIWEKTLRLIQDHPVLGAGPGNWTLAIPAYGSQGTMWAEGLVVPTRPHNVYLQVASETGLPGAMLYFGMWLYIITTGLATVRRSQSEQVRVLSILMLAGLAAFATDSLFSFPTERIEHSLYIMIMGGVVLGLHSNLSKQDPQRSPNKWLRVCALAIILFNLFLGYEKYKFEKHMKLARSYRKENQHINVIDEVEAGKSRFVTLDPKSEPLEMHSSIAYRSLKNYEMALREIYTAKSYHPNSTRIYTTMGVIHSDVKQYDKAINSYQQALKFAPGYKIAIKNLAVAYYHSGNYSECIETLKKLSIDSAIEEFMKKAKLHMEAKLNNGDTKR